MGTPNSKLACPGRHLTLFRPGMGRKIEVQETLHKDAVLFATRVVISQRLPPGFESHR